MVEGGEKEGMLKVFRKEYGAVGYSVVGLGARMRCERQMTAVISIRLQPQHAPRAGQ